ncbi:MAG: zinc-ribbon domain-containing protein [Eubacteriaceae bacterium]
MFCKNCGKEMRANSEFCQGCGAKNKVIPPSSTPTQTHSEKKISTLSLIGLILSIIGFAMDFFILSNALGLIFIGLILSIVSLHKSFKASGNKGFITFFTYAFSNVKVSDSPVKLDSIAFIVSFILFILNLIVYAL